MMKNGEWRESKKEHDKSKLLGVSSFFVVYLLYKLLYKKKKKRKEKKKKKGRKKGNGSECPFGAPNSKIINYYLSVRWREEKVVQFRKYLHN